MPGKTLSYLAIVVFFLSFLTISPCHSDEHFGTSSVFDHIRAQSQAAVSFLDKNKKTADLKFLPSKDVAEEDPRRGYHIELNGLDEKLARSIDISLNVLFAIVGMTLVVIIFSCCFIFGILIS